jgi:hypothetical protein
VKGADQQSIAERRDEIRRRIHAQRQVIAEQLGPDQDDDGYPRSKLMRFLTRRPGVAVSAIAEVVALFAGARHARAVTTALAISRIVRSAAFNGSRRARRREGPLL